MKGVRYNIGGARGHHVPGAEVPTPIASGTVTVTNQRIVFQSTNQAREWPFAKLLGFQHDPQQPITYFQVSTRQKVSGVGYTAAFARVWQFRLAVALAEFQGQLPDLVIQLQKEIVDHEAKKPSTSIATTLPSGPQPSGSA
jgi:hypothetical protein